MCKWGKTEDVLVKIPKDLSLTGKERWKKAKIDSCIAPLVKALQRGGIDMRGSCCGHYKQLGEIHLQDGRILLIGDAKKWLCYRTKYLFELLIKTIWSRLMNNLHSLINHFEH